MLFRALSESRHRWTLNVEAGADRWKTKSPDKLAPVFQAMPSPAALFIETEPGSGARAPKRRVQWMEVFPHSRSP